MGVEVPFAQGSRGFQVFHFGVRLWLGGLGCDRQRKVDDDCLFLGLVLLR